MKQKDYFYDQMEAAENGSTYAQDNDETNAHTDARTKDPWEDPTYDAWDASAWETPEDIPPPTDADCPPERDDWQPSADDYTNTVAGYTRENPFADTPFDTSPPPYRNASAPEPPKQPTHTDASAPEPPTQSPKTIRDITQHCVAQMPSSCITFHPKLKVPVVDEWAFVTWLSEFAQVRCINYQFYLFGTKVAPNELKRMMLEMVRDHAEVSAPRLVSMVSLLESFTTCPAPTVNADSIAFVGKTLTMHRTEQPNTSTAQTTVGEHLRVLPQGLHNPTETEQPTEPTQPTITMRMQPSADFSFCRLPHHFDATVGEPTRLLAFLGGLFAPDDLPTVQEYLGYCLMPSTKAQKALFIIGKGGEGKSRISVLMKLVLGDAAVVSSVAKISERFFPSMLENRLLFIDDDLQTAKFNATDVFKSLVTCETDIVVEQKGKPHYEMRPYARFLLMGNQSVGSLHDKSHGFYRRVHIIHTLPAPKGRVNNPTLIQDIWAAEQAEILLWLVKGALRLARQNYQLTESEASRAALAALKEEDNTALSFLKEQSFVYAEGCNITSSVLTAKYKEWCYDNDLFKVGGQAFKQTCEAYFGKNGGEYSRTVPSALGRVRGYTGVAFSY